MSYFTNKRLYSPNIIGRSYPSSSSDAHRSYGQPNKKRKLFFRLVAGAIFVALVCIFRFIKNVLIGLPDINSVNDMVFNEATIIQDRNGEVLYKLFEENRQYV